ncbi:delta-aminolevulinic acid dehydratase [Halalkalibacterium halodurans]|jgi:hypothetical protein|uniref:BH1897 protein n=1 Tax=Halalkalibacterium halodurans (strain ATCC BAA-125 / DSM 18197 / FERM 7344 / JCM 9153 / C-125) TaxID=272558 RepID=Q9KBM9_HALH5|nr:hypothetical protein [Halalkalibacterium halodurans]MED4082660.1 delta-aminolevulinic acid dehydratase [Halalkalibacterium halodurans]MED4087205.1 delta-aminolevulinic acid dehydratase [Halalkalibacterium halodurans]MED4105956.1 delta-aminolevulinic acid dehydratase [Halalkalibacterium halodurans]MED4111026.1 delta-aminolevulinic acid dehydratase [Halalkalibacterium halodurans]MED4151194.1 delta-aminolevulinic acid dehydratase [Halalkalibacterium halodurans]
MSKPVMHVSLVIGPNCEMESYALRSTLEYFGARVNVHWVGRPNDFVDVLSGVDREQQVDYLLLNFHGDEGRFCLPVLSEDIYEPGEPKGEFFSADDVIRSASVKGVKVLATGCTLGVERLAESFLQCGCPSFIGPIDYIDGNANLMFVTRFMYELITNGKREQEAFTIAAAMDQETSLYRRYTAVG